MQTFLILMDNLEYLWKWHCQGSFSDYLLSWALLTTFCTEWSTISKLGLKIHGQVMRFNICLHTGFVIKRCFFKLVQSAFAGLCPSLQSPERERDTYRDKVHLNKYKHGYNNFWKRITFHWTMAKQRQWLGSYEQVLSVLDGGRLVAWKLFYEYCFRVLCFKYSYTGG